MGSGREQRVKQTAGPHFNPDSARTGSEPHTDTGIEARKAFRATLRRQAVAARHLQKNEVIAGWSAQLCARLLTLFPQPPGGVAGFCWPIQQEPDVRPAIATWRSAGLRAALPVVRQTATPLDFVEWTPETPMQADQYGIPTPVEGAVLTPDVLLIPLNAFDRAGFRIGYGGGYFDRTIASMTPRPLCIGVGFELGWVDSIQPEPHDQRLDWIVTEAGSWSF